MEWYLQSAERGTHFWNTVRSFSKNKHTRTTWPSNSTPRYIPSKNVNVCPHKNLCLNFHGSIIYTVQKSETIQQLNNIQLWKKLNTYIHHRWIKLENINVSERVQSQKAVVLLHLLNVYVVLLHLLKYLE